MFVSLNAQQMTDYSHGPVVYGTGAAAGGVSTDKPEPGIGEQARVERASARKKARERRARARAQRESEGEGG